jgi:hypothetical protein
MGCHRRPTGKLPDTRTTQSPRLRGSRCAWRLRPSARAVPQARRSRLGTDPLRAPIRRPRPRCGSISRALSGEWLLLQLGDCSQHPLSVNRRGSRLRQDQQGSVRLVTERPRQSVIPDSPFSAVISFRHHPGDCVKYCGVPAWILTSWFTGTAPLRPITRPDE